MTTHALFANSNGKGGPVTSLALAVAIALSGIGALSASAATASTSTFATIAHPTALRQGDAVLGALPMAQSMHIEVALKMRDRDGLDAFIANNAKNQARGIAAQLMTPAQFLANHAPMQMQAQVVADYLTRMGYTHVVIAPNRLLVSADGTARTARDAFMTTFAQVRTHDGRIAFANTDAVRIPAALQDSVLAVVGLQTVHQAHTFARRLSGAHTDTITGHDPTEFSSIYGGAGSVVASGINIGIITEGSLAQTRADLTMFAFNHGLSGVLTSTVNTNGISTDTSGTGEWDLDSQDIVAMAGGEVKKITFYNIPSLANSDLVADFNTVVTRNETRIINVSIGECETDAQGDGSAAAADAIFATAVAQGQTFSVATGDSGADECGDGTNTPSWPADSQYVVAVAGTRLNASTTTWSNETVWANSGGSASTFEPMPSWQTSFGLSGTKRVVADVAFDADPNSGSIILVNGSLAQYGGTSLSAPLFAGLWARVLQTYPAIGFAGPVIYALPTEAFHDITVGKNSGGETGIGYTATTGYDFANGRGSMMIGNTLTDSAGLGNQPPVANFSFATTGYTANFTDTSTDSDGTIVSHSWNFGDGSTSTATNPSHTYAGAGIYFVRERVIDNDGASVGIRRKVTASAVQLLRNTSFETGTAAPWSISAGVLLNDSSLAHSGNWYAEIGRYAGNQAETDHVSQVVTIPSGYTSATLAFYLHVTPATPCCANKLHVNVYNASGTFLATLATYTDFDSTPDYVLHSLDMTPYIGQKVTIKFLGFNGGGTTTHWFLDDVTLTVQ